MTTLVLGATGFVGRALIPALSNEGEHVRAGSRAPRDPRKRAAPDVEHVQCDVRDLASLERAFEAVDSVYYLVHSMGKGIADFADIERKSATNVSHAAAASGCRRIVYLGGVAPRGPASEHLASRLEVGAILRAGKVRTVELRASMIIGQGSASWRIVRDLALRLPFMLLPRWLESKSCPVALPDAVTALLDARRLPLDESAWFDIPGPEVLRAREMLEAVAELQGRVIPSLRVPYLTPRLSAGWLKLISDADYDVARELVLGLRNDLLPRDARYWDLTGHPPRWTFRRAAAAALEAERRPPGLGGWLTTGEERLVRGLGRHIDSGATSSK